MSEKKIAYFWNSEDKTFVNSREINEDPNNAGYYPCPARATFVAPDLTLVSPYVNVWNGSAWEKKEDHRKHLDETGTYVGGTPYWPEGATYKDEASYMTELGPIPDGASLTQPEKPEEMTQYEDLKSQIAKAKAYLSDTDYVVTKIAEGVSTADDYAEILAERKTQRESIDPLQAQVDTLKTTLVELGFEVA